MSRARALVITCEHASNVVPRSVEERVSRGVRTTHRAYDMGALQVAEHLAAALGAPLFRGHVSRLVIDLNRSLHHRGLSAIDLTISEREKLIRRYYQPYRESVEGTIQAAIDQGHSVLHLAIHSFTPVLRGEQRRADIGLLYDPGRPTERMTAYGLQDALREGGGLRVRRNYPYRGVADGFPTALRKRFPEPAYAGLEVELNQKRLRGATAVAAIAVRVESAVRGQVAPL